MLEKFLNWITSQRRAVRLLIGSTLMVSSAITMPAFIYIFCLINLGHFSFVEVIACSEIILLLIAIHELGHLFMAKLCGVPTQGIYFLPIFGAVAIIRKENLKTPLSRWRDFLISAGGSITSLIALFLIFAFLPPTCNLVKAAVMIWGFVSFYNLLSIYPYDGGRIFLDWAAKFKRRALIISRIAGWLTQLAISVAIVITCGFGWKNLLAVAVLWILYIILMKAGKIANEDKEGEPMKPIAWMVSIVISGLLISGFAYIFIATIWRF